MNENLNLVEILKDCPKGTKFYTPMFGEVKFEKIHDFTIVVFVSNLHLFVCFTKKGFYHEGIGECTLLPSKEQRDWSKFKPTYEFKDGDIVATNTGNWIGITTGGHANSPMPTYCVLSHNREVKLYFGRKEEWGFNRLATEEEKQRLFEAIKDKGYKWNAETKTLEKLVKHKFDPKTLQPFDKVLARDEDYSNWRCTLFSHYNKDDGVSYPCVTVGEVFSVCIPYNEDTKHLLGTSDEAPEYYRYWED